MCTSWHVHQQIDAFWCDIIHILDYLCFLCKKGYEYWEIVSHSSAIPTFNDHTDGKSVGQHLLEMWVLYWMEFTIIGLLKKIHIYMGCSSSNELCKIGMRGKQKLIRKYLTFKVLILKGTLMQIWKSANISVSIQK